MIKYMLKTGGLIVILFIGVLIGMQQANIGMKKMKGYDDPALQSAFHVSTNHQGEVEASVLGRKINEQTITEKKEMLQEMKAFNFFSEMGKKFTQVLSGGTEKLLSYIWK